jgi:uncharacterized protein
VSTYVDTSAVFALLDADDTQHEPASAAWGQLHASRERLVTTNYVLVETAALLARRIGLEAVRAFHTDVVPLLHIIWVDRLLHERAMSAVLTAGQRDLSLVDCVGFTVMRDHGLDTAFALDTHFVRQGFRCLPP